MKSNEFCCWLQGYFEINECNSEEVSLTAQQFEYVKKHLNLVKTVEDVKHGSFVSWLDTFLDLIDYENIDSNLVKKLRNKLNQNFNGPFYEEQDQLNQIHGNIKYRC